ncbi:unnamed protein product [Rhodiola kirilowii]
MMKYSNLGCSSINNSTAFNLEEDHQDQDVEEDQESGWTAYFDDYFSNKTSHPASKNMDDHYSYDDDGCHGGSVSMLCSLHTPSVVSDAASCAAWKSSQHKNQDVRSMRSAETVAACSSFDGRQMVIHKKLIRSKITNRHKRFGDYYDDSLEDTASSPVNSPKAKEDYGHDHQQARHDEMKHQADEVKSYKDANRSLRKKGLCLVPYSTLINYAGN